MHRGENEKSADKEEPREEGETGSREDRTYDRSMTRFVVHATRTSVKRFYA